MADAEVSQGIDDGVLDGRGGADGYISAAESVTHGAENQTNE